MRNVLVALTILAFLFIALGETLSSSYTIHLIGKRWNLVSVPFEDFSASGCEGVYMKIYYYDPWKGTYKKVSDVNDMVPGKGYWVYVKEDCTLTFTGEEPVSIGDIRLTKGWNLISGFYVNERTGMKEDLFGSCTITKGPWYYDASSKEWVKVEEFELGKGYWVYCEELKVGSCVYNRDEEAISCDTNCRSDAVLAVVYDTRGNVAIAMRGVVERGNIMIDNGKLKVSTQPSLDILEDNVRTWRIIVVCEDPVGEVTVGVSE